jgi:hypothetical protein
VQRLLKALRKKTAEKLLAQESLGTTAVILTPGTVGLSPPMAPPG